VDIRKSITAFVSGQNALAAVFRDANLSGRSNKNPEHPRSCRCRMPAPPIMENGGHRKIYLSKNKIESVMRKALTRSFRPQNRLTTVQKMNPKKIPSVML